MTVAILRWPQLCRRFAHASALSQEQTFRLGRWGRGGMLEVLTANEQLRARLELASRLGALAIEPSDLGELFRALYAETGRLMEATVFLFALYDEASQTVEVVRQVDGGVEHEGGSFPLGKGFTSDVIRTGEPRLVKRWSEEGPPVRLLYGTEAGELVRPESAAGVPIVSSARVLGGISGLY